MPALLYSHGRPGFYMRVLEEGEVGAGDAIERVAVGPEAMSVREVSALLYLPGHTPRGLRRALAIPALPEGWRGSFEALLEQHERGAAGNHGLARPLDPAGLAGAARVSRGGGERARARRSARSPSSRWTASRCPASCRASSSPLKLEPAEAPAALLRSYSLAAPPDERGYRIAVKREADGPASAFLHDRVAVGDVVAVGAPRGDFTLDVDATGPVVLLSAGVGVTPVLAMLGALARAGSERAGLVDPRRPQRRRARLRRRGTRAAVAASGGTLARALQPPATRRPPGPSTSTKPAGSTSMSCSALGVPRDADFYLCGPAGVSARADRGPARLGRRARAAAP